MKISIEVYSQGTSDPDLTTVAEVMQAVDQLAINLNDLGFVTFVEIGAVKSDYNLTGEKEKNDA